MNNAAVGKTTDKVYDQFTLTSWDEDDPYKAIDVAHERCFQKGRWCLEPKQQNITKGVHGLLLIIKAFRFFKDAPGMEPELARLMSRIETITHLTNEVCVPHACS